MRLGGGLFNQLYAFQALVMIAAHSNTPLVLPHFSLSIVSGTGSRAFRELFRADCFAAAMHSHGLVVLDEATAGTRLVKPPSSKKLFDHYAHYVEARLDPNTTRPVFTGGPTLAHADQLDAAVYRALHLSARLERTALHIMQNRSLDRAPYGCLHARIEKDMRFVAKMRPPSSLSSILELVGQVDALKQAQTVFVAVGSDIRAEDDALLAAQHTAWGARMVRRATLGDGTGSIDRRNNATPTTAAMEPLAYLESALVDMRICRSAAWLVGWPGSTFSVSMAHYQHLDNGQGFYAYCVGGSGLSLKMATAERMPRPTICRRGRGAPSAPAAPPSASTAVELPAAGTSPAVADAGDAPAVADGTAPAVADAGAAPAGSDVGACLRRTYHSSPLEQSWRDVVSHRGAVCQRVQADLAKVTQQWLALSEAWKNGSRTGDAWSRDVFSYIVTEDMCALEQPAATTPLEPLFAYLRHPLHSCIKHWGVITNKEYLVLPLVTEVLRPRRLALGGRPRALLFDLGASTYSRGMGGSSMNWFIEAYRHHGITFDEIHAWEAKRSRNPMGAAPANVREVTRFYNGVPVDSSPNATHNPLRLLGERALESDFVVLKMDFDQPAMGTVAALDWPLSRSGCQRPRACNQARSAKRLRRNCRQPRRELYLVSAPSHTRHPCTLVGLSAQHKPQSRK